MMRFNVNCDDDFVNNPVEMILAPANDGFGSLVAPQYYLDPVEVTTEINADFVMSVVSQNFFDSLGAVAQILQNCHMPG